MEIIYKLNKELRTYGVRLDVQFRSELFDVKHFKPKQSSVFDLALSQNLKMALIQKIAPTMRFVKMLANCRILVFSKTVKKVALCSRPCLHREIQT